MSSAFLNIATKAAYLAGNTIQQGSRNLSNLKVQKKGHNDFVTDLDKKSEEIIVKTILQAFPEHNILGEEYGNLNKNSDYTWIIDPIDGTTNFVHGYPHYCISIALKHKDKVTHGVILDPNRNDLYKAELGKGAYCNDKRIRVSSHSLEYSLVATGFPSYDMSIIDQYLTIFKEIILSTNGVRREGSAALDLAYVASGHIDGFWEFNLKSWDIAAGILLVREAGGIVIDFNGNQHNSNEGNIIAANSKIANQLQKIIHNHHSK
ncbi:MAG: inositol monophosphatase family protein [Neisseriaceae bacterium]